MLRLGYTETTLLLFYFLDIYEKIYCNVDLLPDKLKYANSQKYYINWLYSTSGFYDKEIKGSYFDFNGDYILKSNIYNEYFSKLLFIIKNTDTPVKLHFQDIHIDECLLVFKQKFLEYINFNNKNKKYENIHQFMENKNILIINNLGSLMKKQFESGNIDKICKEFSKNVKSIEYFENGYTFFNSGPDGSLLETSKNIIEKIKELNFDGVIISAGAYSCILADDINKKLDKETFIVGGDLPLYFGITTKRTTMWWKDLINEHFIKVPDNMKPLNYEKIEEGCYW
jgi:hypothetical protein